MREEGPQTAIVTCMDARLDTAGFLDGWPTAVHVIRSAGGRVTADVLRSLAASCALGTERIALIHHTDCAMAAHTDEQIRDRLPLGAEPGIEFLTIDEPAAALAQDARAIAGSSLLPPDVELRTYIYDLDARIAHEIAVEIP